jgi:transposase
VPVDHFIVQDQLRWSAPRGVPRVNDGRVLNGIFWVLRSGAPWRDLPQEFGPYSTCYNRFVRWRRAGVWGRIMDALAAAHDAAVQMIDTSIVRVHQHAACIARNKRQSMGRSRGRLTRACTHKSRRLICDGHHEMSECGCRLCAGSHRS